MQIIITLVFGLSFIFNSYSYGAQKLNHSLSVMTYNLENLFDTYHDVGKSDWTWTPKQFKDNSKEAQAYCSQMRNEYYKKSCFELDWNSSVLNKKIKNLSRVISSFSNGRGPDIVVFQEIENMNVLRLLVSQGLRKKGYHYMSLVEGLDSRGIDVAMISKYPIIKEQYHNFSLLPYSKRSTRGILEVEFRVGKKAVTVFGNHWPSQGNVDETRMIAAQTLEEKVMASRSDLVIATGDFNTSFDDELNGLNTYILPIMEDIEVKARKLKKVMADGTHWFRGHWQSLDKIFVKKQKRPSYKIDYQRFDIIFHKYMSSKYEWIDRFTGEVTVYQNVPTRFDPKSGKGYSDHLPVVVSFSL